MPLVDVTLSDHFPICFCIELESRQVHANMTQFFLNTSLLHHKPTLAHIVTVWNLDCRLPHDTDWICWWNSAISRTVRFLHIYGHQLAIFRRWSYQATTSALCSATEALVANPFAPTVQVRGAELHH